MLGRAEQLDGGVRANKGWMRSKAGAVRQGRQSRSPRVVRYSVSHEPGQVECGAVLGGVMQGRAADKYSALHQQQGQWHSRGWLGEE